MPPQQPDRLLDRLDIGLRFRAHDFFHRLWSAPQHVAPGSRRRNRRREHFPAKRTPVRGRKCDKPKNPERDPIPLNRIAL
jgi:hypothetical protein